MPDAGGDYPRKNETEIESDSVMISGVLKLYAPWSRADLSSQGLSMLVVACVPSQKLGLIILNSSNDNFDHAQLVRRARMCVGKLRSMDEVLRPTILNAIAARLVKSLRSDQSDDHFSLKLGIATLSEAKGQVEFNSLEWIIAETTLVCLEMTIAPSPPSRAEKLDAREQLGTLGAMMEQGLSERNLSALRSLSSWPYSGRNLVQ